MLGGYTQVLKQICAKWRFTFTIDFNLATIHLKFTKTLPSLLTDRNKIIMFSYTWNS